MNFTKSAFLFVIFLYCSTAVAVSVQRKNVNYTSALGSPITTLNTGFLDKGGWSFSQRTEYYQNQPLSYLTLITNPGAESQNGSLINYLVATYGINNHFNVGGSLPYQNGFGFRSSSLLNDNGSPTIQYLGNNSGFADASLYGLWQITPATNDATLLSSAIIAGSNFPTGKTNTMTNTGELFVAADQPGTGAFVPYVGIIFSKEWKGLMFSHNLFYAHPSKGTQYTTLGSVFDYNFAVVADLYEGKAKKINYSINGVLELNGEYTTHDVILNESDPNSGGNIVYLSPGIRVNIGEKVSFYTNINIPTFQRINGIQSLSEYNIYSGLDFVF
jgi:hypothetical protein